MYAYTIRMNKFNDKFYKLHESRELYTRYAWIYYSRNLYVYLFIYLVSFCDSCTRILTLRINKNNKHLECLPIPF